MNTKHLPQENIYSNYKIVYGNVILSSTPSHQVQ